MREEWFGQATEWFQKSEAAGPYLFEDSVPADAKKVKSCLWAELCSADGLIDAKRENYEENQDGTIILVV